MRLQTVQGRISLLGSASESDLPHFYRILPNHTVSYRIPQTRVERWIHELALRNTMTRAHRQAWAWQVIYRSEGRGASGLRLLASTLQDEWCGLTIGDIRKLEDEVALHLSTVMANK